MGDDANGMTTVPCNVHTHSQTHTALELQWLVMWYKMNASSKIREQSERPVSHCLVMYVLLWSVCFGFKTSLCAVHSIGTCTLVKQGEEGKGQGREEGEKERGTGWGQTN